MRFRIDTRVYRAADSGNNQDWEHDEIMPGQSEKARQPKTKKKQAAKRLPATPRAARPARPAHGKTVDSAGLNPAQREAVRTLRGPVLVIAGAGTGKTLTLVHRLAELVRSGVPAESILLLTFTRRAAGEMIARASALPGGGCQGVAGGTFHSFANATLRRYGPAIDIPATFTILDQSDTFEILSGIRSDLELSKRGRGFPRRETIAAILSKAANKQVTIEEVLRQEYAQFRHEAAVLGKIDCCSTSTTCCCGCCSCWKQDRMCASASRGSTAT
jgi:hypothetical protein